MNWLHFFKTQKKPQYPFGRGINASLSKDEENLFNKSAEAFEKHDILGGYDFFLRSLIHYMDDISKENVVIKQENNKLNFIIYQGSAKITAEVTKKYLQAEVLMIKSANANVALKRYILERNYQFTYAFYLSDGENIKLKIYSDNNTMSPQKLFFPLRELALNADFDKEHIKTEFPDINLEDIEHLEMIDNKELKIKYNYLHKWIDDLELKISTLPASDTKGMHSFLYLNLLFKIDYLLLPKYRIYQKMSKKIQKYFSDETSGVEAKNEELKKEILNLKKLSFEVFSSNFYNAKYTFSPFEKTPYEELSNFIDETLLKVRWYKNNRYPQIIPTIYEYIAFYSLYNYGLNQVLKELLSLLVEVQNPNFFKEFGYKVLYDSKTQTLAKKEIINRIDTIINSHKDRFKSIRAFGKELNFDTLNEFSNSFYIQIKHLNFEGA